MTFESGWSSCSMRCIILQNTPVLGTCNLPIIRGSENCILYESSVSKRCPSSGIPNRTEPCRKWICFCPRVTKWRSTNAVVPISTCLSRWNLRCVLLSVRRSCSPQAVGAEIWLMLEWVPGIASYYSQANHMNVYNKTYYTVQLKTSGFCAATTSFQSAKQPTYCHSSKLLIIDFCFAQSEIFCSDSCYWWLQTHMVLDIKFTFLSAFAKLRKARISFVMSVRTSVRMEQLCFQ
jgi:hypothetical protein